MQPTAGDVHVNTPLTNLSIAFLQKQENFIASRVFPVISVMKQSDRYYTYDRGSFNRDEMQLRGPASESHGSGYSIDNTPTYYCPVYAIHKDVDDQTRANADSALALDREATIFVTQKALIKREKLWATGFFAASLWTTEYTGVNSGASGANLLRWNDAASNPIEDVRLAKRTVLESTGFEPNKLTLGRAVYDTLLDHPDIIDRIKYGQAGVGGPAMATRDRLAQLFEVDEILVSNAISNTAAEGAANVHAFILGKHALLTYSPAAAGLMTASAGYTFGWNGYLGAGAEGNRIKQFRMEQLAADRVELEMAFAHKLVAADLGAFFNTIVA